MSDGAIPRTSVAESILLQLPARLLLGGMFAYAAYNKIPDVQLFAEAIKGFRVVDADTHPELIIMGAFVIPWFELIAGVMLIVGLRARAAALGIALLMGVFIYALMSVIMRGIHADCSCFGDESLICEAGVGWCQVIRNAVLMVPCIYLLLRGPGRLSIDQMRGGRDQNPNGGVYTPESLGDAVDADGSRA